MAGQDPGGELPPHIERTVEAIARLHEQHRAGSTGVQRVVEAVTGFVARPRFAGLVAMFLLAWIAANLILARTRAGPFDPWPFEALQGIASFGAVFLTIFVLITERRENELSELREQLTLELAIAAEQKSAKIIGLLEELRRDLPNVRDRHDPEAHDLARPADPQAVFEALKQNQGDKPGRDDGQA